MSGGIYLATGFSKDPYNRFIKYGSHYRLWLSESIDVKVEELYRDINKELEIFVRAVMWRNPVRNAGSWPGTPTTMGTLIILTLEQFFRRRFNVVKHKYAKLFMTYAGGKLEAALNISHLILSKQSEN